VETAGLAVAAIVGSSEGAARSVLITHHSSFITHQEVSTMSKVLYSKKNYSKEVEIDVLHPRYPGAVFGFAFAKK
jgi:hypothetical protein